VPKQQIAFIAAVSLAVLCLAVAVGTARRTPALSARVIGVIDTGTTLKVKVQLTNSTAYVYLPVATRLEVWNGMSWDTCRDLSSMILGGTHDVPQRSANDFTCEMIFTYRHGERFRLVIEGYRAMRGLGSFSFRLRRRLFHGDRAMSLSPLDPTPILIADTVAVTEEF
jgi:hypothetical protein